MDWHQLWTIASAPDNVPIVAMLFSCLSLPGWESGRRGQMTGWPRAEADPGLAKRITKVEPWRPGWAKELHVWPYLVHQFLVAVIVT
jgi:hypothetical protein